MLEAHDQCWSCARRVSGHVHCRDEDLQSDGTCLGYSRDVVDEVAEWLPSLGEASRERVYAVMRDLLDESSRNWERARDLGPRAGVISLGSDDMTYVLKATAIDAFLAGLRRGETPEVAERSARGDVSAAVSRWNERCRCRASFGGVETLRFSSDANPGSGILMGLRQAVERAAQG